jgi:hypothetical protein
MLVWLASLGAVGQPTRGADLEKSQHGLILLLKIGVFLKRGNHRRGLAS